jgi:nitrogenase molybdenum-cofactor synthesis protein NifE
MSKLCIYIPPFASDYTGVCATMFDLDCLMAINDASCCTGHYVYYDEPRWAEKARPTFSTQLRTLDAILGNDKKVVDCVLKMSENVDTKMIALIGTPVPAITGMDMEGMAYEIEYQCGKPALGFNTTGFEYYDAGIAQAGKALIDYFAPKSSKSLNKREHSVNIIGMTPLDYGNKGNDTALRTALEQEGWEVNACLFMGTSLDELKRIPEAQINIAVSAAGLSCAKYLKSRFGMPYVAIAPMGNEYFSHISDIIEGKNIELTSPKGNSGKRALIIMDQVMGNSLRNALHQAGCPHNINVASFFGWDKNIAEAADFFIPSEKELMMAIRSGKYDYVIGDPSLSKIPDMATVKYFGIAHPAVSGKLQWANVPEYLSDTFDKEIKKSHTK